MQNVPKGQYGYFRTEKRRRFFVMAGLFVLPIAVFVIGFIVLQTRNTIITVIYAVGCLPACMSAVSLIMVIMRNSIPEEEYKEIEKHKGTLNVCYEMYMTTYEKNTMVDAAAICGKTVVGLVTDPKADVPYTQDHITKILRANGYSSQVNLLTDLNHFTERMDSMNEHAESLRSGITYKKDNKYPDLGIEDLIKHTMLAISL